MALLCSTNPLRNYSNGANMTGIGNASNSAHIKLCVIEIILGMEVEIKLMNVPVTLLLESK